MLPSLKNPKLKIERAKEHLDILNVKLGEFQDLDPFRATTQEDVQNALYIIRIKIPIIDPRLAIIAGDAVDNLRSALDHIAWQLALTKTDRPFYRTCFPVINENTAGKMQMFIQVTKDIPSEAVKEIEALQPYLGESNYKDNLLWKLDKLCNINKHRVIPAQGTALDFKIPKGIKPTTYTQGDEYIAAMPIAVKSKMQSAPTPIPDVLLGSEVDGLVISIKELPKIYEFVRDNVITRFTRFFPE